MPLNSRLSGSARRKDNDRSYTVIRTLQRRRSCCANLASARRSAILGARSRSNAIKKGGPDDCIQPSGAAAPSERGRSARPRSRRMRPNIAAIGKIRANRSLHCSMLRAVGVLEAVRIEFLSHTTSARRSHAAPIWRHDLRPAIRSPHT